ncbi:MAG: DNA primase noncatalytic subunit PriX [Sulfolobales archaeon]
MNSKDLLIRIKEKCSEEPSGECLGYIDEFLDTVSSEIREKRRGSDKKRYEWIEKIILRGLPDGRKRFILKVLTPYLVNVLSLGDEDALNRIHEFIENSCRNHGNCEKIYDSWLKGDIRRVRSKKLKPAKYENLDEDLKDLIEKVISS